MDYLAGGEAAPRLRARARPARRPLGDVHHDIAGHGSPVREMDVHHALDDDVIAHELEPYHDPEEVASHHSDEDGPEDEEWMALIEEALLAEDVLESDLGDGARLRDAVDDGIDVPGGVAGEDSMLEPERLAAPVEPVPLALGVWAQMLLQQSMRCQMPNQSRQQANTTTSW